MESFTCKTKIFCGEGSLRSLGELGIRKLCVVTDPFFLQNGKAAEIGAVSKAEKVTFFGEVTPDPSAETIAKAVSVLQGSEADAVVALGGGSAMDCAKAAVYFSGLPCRLIAVPTTSGSGSEVTNFAVITAGNVKYPLVDDRLQPDYAILDSDLLKSLPRGLIADSGFDAVAHAVEGFAGKNHTPMSDAMAAGALQRLLALLPGSFAGDAGHRLEIHCASTMAAMSFSQAGLGACHALSHALGGMFHVPHGRLNAVLLPAVLAANSREKPARYAALARQAGISGASDFMAVKNLKTAITTLRRQLCLPETLPQAGISGAQLRKSAPEILKAAMSDACAATNPVPVTENYLREILREVGSL